MRSLVTAAELAARLGVSPATISSWTREGLIPVLRIRSNVYRYDFDAVLAALEDHDQAEGRDD